MQRSLIRLVLFTLVATAFGSQAMALNQVNVGAPAINCVFSSTCSVVVNDMTTPIFNGGFVQSRVFQSQAGTQANGKWVYEYRIDMRYVNPPLNVPYVDSIQFPYSGGVPSLDYNGDGIYTDQVFVVTSGGTGTIAPSSNGYLWGIVWFNFSPAVWAGYTPGTGESSYFWGMTSNYAPHVVNATIGTSNGDMTVQVYAPNP